MKLILYNYFKKSRIGLSDFFLSQNEINTLDYTKTY